MPALDNVFMTAVTIIGAPLAIGSFIIDEEIAKTGCGGKDAHNYATGIMILSLVMCVASISFVVCKKKCDCRGEDLDLLVYIGGGIVLSTVLLYLSISLAKKIDFAKSSTAGNIVWFLVGSSATALMICLGMASYRIYSRQKATGSSTDDVSPSRSPSRSPRRSSADSIQTDVLYDPLSEEPSRVNYVPSTLSAAATPDTTISSPETPPWEKYPSTGPRSTAWGQGERNKTLGNFHGWLDSLTAANRKAYLKQPSIPPVWSDYYLEYTLID
jgi:hypothetical protein